MVNVGFVDGTPVTLTPEDAESLLIDGNEVVHNFVASGMMIGCDYSRENAVAAFRRAVRIEIGGDNCKAMGHALIVWDRDDHCSFFEADKEKVAAFEAARACP